MKKRLLSIVLSLCMVLALMPQMVFAENGDTSELQNLLNGGGTVTMEKDYTITSTLKVNNIVTLDLNGHVIKMTGDGSVINVGSNGNLTLKDSKSEAGHSGDDASLPAGGVITNDYPGAEGIGVHVYGGSFTMNGGTIYKCHMDIGGGGGVRVEKYGRFTMTGGAICDCSARKGGGVDVTESRFTMTGGAIYGCSAKNEGGGGVYVADSRFTMTGGTIYDCLAEDFGDAVTVNIDSIVDANGGTIKGTVFSYGRIQNTATDGGCTRFYDEVTNATTSLGDHGTISGGIYYGGISGGGTVEDTYHTVSFDLNGGSGSIPKQWFVNIDTAQALEPVAPTREGYEFAGWYLDEELKTPYDFESEVKDNITLYAGWKEEKITLTVPFTTTVEVSGNASPGETTFNLEVVDSHGNELQPNDYNVEITASVETDGAGDYNGNLTFTGTASAILRMFDNERDEYGYIYVKQAGVNDSNWDVDEAAWGLFHRSVVDLSDEEVEPSPIYIFPAVKDGTSYSVEYGENGVDKMTFVNKYARSAVDPSDSEGTTNGEADKDSKADAEDSVKTGDNANLTLWIALMLLAGAGITGTTIYTKRKRTNE
ncbi:InlB B-repeat-containing protein [Anaerofustis butyriciformans]|uniref:InlB B-repeat-containing protein n=1 Tax=Anaerofustis butyriciformans TaxID=3108533 RepID=UPI003F8BE958